MMREYCSAEQARADAEYCTVAGVAWQAPDAIRFLVKSIVGRVEANSDVLLILADACRKQCEAIGGAAACAGLTAMADNLAAVAAERVDPVA